LNYYYFGFFNNGKQVTVNKQVLWFAFILHWCYCYLSRSIWDWRVKN